ncbi:hypothetical protein BGZ76_008974 [Entomortierella beljakovae]|nr:hypothetical protein BGZ76_008974 [Entomortierella beljakovae]
MAQCIRGNHPTGHYSLLFPEVLDLVFSYLDFKSLLLTRLVCRTWNPIAFRFISISAQIFPEYEATLLDTGAYPFVSQLHSATILDISDKTDVLKRSTKELANESSLKEYLANSGKGILIDPLLDQTLNIILSWGTKDNPQGIMDFSGEQSLNSELKIQRLVLRAIMKYEFRLNRILTVFPMLTSIEIVDAMFTKFYILPILVACPKLKSLTINFAVPDEIFWNYKPKSPPPPSFNETDGSLEVAIVQSLSIDDEISYHNQPIPDDNFTHGLEKLKLQFIIMDQTSLETLCSATPFLKSFEVRFLRFRRSPGVRGGTFRRKDFYYHLSKVCPRIESLHFTLYDTTMRLEEAVAIQDSFSKLKELGMAGKDTENCDHGVKIQLMEHYVNHLTTLEIVCYSWSQGNAIIPRFHEFMCNARHLKHLIAPTLRYSTWCMDLVEVPRTMGDGDGDSVSARRAVYSSRRIRDGDVARQHKLLSKDWACQDLETLHLGFAQPLHQKSTLIHGYITRHCPHLKDIWIVMERFDSSLEGGLCLLTQLRGLEKLRIETRSKEVKLKPDDINWIGCFRDTPNWINGMNSSIKLESQESEESPAKEESRNKSESEDSSDTEESSDTKGISKSESLETSDPITSFSILSRVAKVFLADEKWFSSQSTPQDNSKKDVNFTETDIIEAIDNLPFFLSTESSYPCWPSLRALEFVVEKHNLFKDPKDIDLISTLRPDIKFTHSHKFTYQY